MTTPPEPSFRGNQGFREMMAAMTQSIFDAEPSPFEEGGYVRRVVEIRGARTGKVHQVPLAVITLYSRNYIVSPRANRNWVRNLTANPDCVIATRDTREPRYGVRVIDRVRAAEVISSYLKLMNAPWAVAQFPFSADANLDVIIAAADKVAVFELTDPHDAR